MYEEAAKDQALYEKLKQTFKEAKITHTKNFEVCKIIFNSLKEIIEDGFKFCQEDLENIIEKIKNIKDYTIEDLER